MLTGSGFLIKMDQYGIFDCLSHISAISGGSWLLASLILNNFNITAIQKWDIEDSLLRGIPDIEVHDKDIVTRINMKDASEIIESDEWFYDQLTESKVLEKRSEDSFNTFEKFFAQMDQYSDTLNNNSLRKRTVNYFSLIKDVIINSFKNKETTIDKDLTIKGMVQSFKKFRTALEFYIEIHSEVRGKRMLGFPLSFTDYWGRALIRHIGVKMNSSDTVNSLAQSFQESSKFQSFQMPIPILVSNCKNEQLKDAVFEFTPFEFGSWNVLKLFVKLRYLGSKIISGKPQFCVNGFDDISFLTATSSSLFNNVLIYIWQLVAPSLETRNAVRAIISTFGLDFRQSSIHGGKINFTLARPEYALYGPNPFYKYPNVESVLTNESQLYLVDGGEDGENVPIRSLAIPERSSDLIFALDSSSDVNNYPNGSMLRNLYDHYMKEEHIETSSTYRPNYPFVSLPFIPSSEFFARGNLLSRPIAFGCNLESYSLRKGAEIPSKTSPKIQTPPIIIYYANYNHSFPSNTSTFKLRYSEQEVEGMLDNGKDIFSFDSSSFFMKCIGCLMVKRTYDRHIIEGGQNKPPTFCQKCYYEFCYN